MTKPTVYIALDYADAKDALALVAQLSPQQCGLKVGKQLFTSAGPDLVADLVGSGFSVFLDLKFHDIPHTVARAAESAAKLGVDYLTVHTLGGGTMLRTAAAAVDQAVQLLAVTVLTSHDSAELSALGLSDDIPTLVQRFAAIARDSGVTGVVCSAWELAAVQQCWPEAVTMVPGIRPTGSPTGNPVDSALDDQRRVMTPAEAIRAGARHLVIGRPVTQASSPSEAIMQITEDIADTV